MTPTTAPGGKGSTRQGAGLEEKKSRRMERQKDGEKTLLDLRRDTRTLPPEASRNSDRFPIRSKESGPGRNPGQRRFVRALESEVQLIFNATLEAYPGKPHTILTPPRRKHQ